MADLPDSGALSNASLTVSGFQSLIEDLRDSVAQGLTTFQLANTYELGAITIASDNVLYISQTNGNLGNSPSVDDGSNWKANPFLNYKGDWSGLTGALSKGMSVSYADAIWKANVAIASVSGTRPSDNNADWMRVTPPIMWDYVVSQLNGGVSSSVAMITSTSTINVGSYNFLIYIDDGRVYYVGGVTGTMAGDFNPATGVDSGLSGPLVNIDQNQRLDGMSIDVTMPNSNYTLTALQNRYGRINLNGTLTGQRTLNVGNKIRSFKVKNNTDYAIKVKTSSGTGVHVESGEMFNLRCDGVNILSEGVENKVLIKDVTPVESGTTTYPNLLTQSDFYEIQFNFTDSTSPNQLRDTSILSKDKIEAYPTSWAVIGFFGSSTSTVNVSIDYASSTSFETSGSIGNGALAEVYGYLIDGLTY